MDHRGATGRRQGRSPHCLTGIIEATRYTWGRPLAYRRRALTGLQPRAWTGQRFGWFGWFGPSLLLCLLGGRGIWGSSCLELVSRAGVNMLVHVSVSVHGKSLGPIDALPRRGKQIRATQTKGPACPPISSSWPQAFAHWGANQLLWSPFWAFHWSCLFG